MDLSKNSKLLFGKAHLPIDDFHLLESPDKYSNDEKQLRIKLTAVYRLIELNGWSMGIYNHVTAKVDGDMLLIHPFGLHYNEITASSMLKILTNSGKIVDQGTTNFEVNFPGYIIHSAVHLARPELKSVIHLHYPPVSAVSAFKHGLLPVCQEQALLGEIRYLDYSGILTDEDERDAVMEAFGNTSCKVMILRNHGLLVAGESVEEAFYNTCNLMRACESQARLLAAGGLDNLVFMSKEAAQQAYHMVQNARYPIKAAAGGTGAGELCPETVTHVTADAKPQWQGLQSYNGSGYAESTASDSTSGNESDLDGSASSLTCLKADSQPPQMQRRGELRKKIVGYVNMFELDFEAQMRGLDLAGHQTGYAYKRPLIRNYKRC